MGVRWDTGKGAGEVGRTRSSRHGAEHGWGVRPGEAQGVREAWGEAGPFLRSEDLWDKMGTHVGVQSTGVLEMLAFICPVSVHSV